MSMDARRPPHAMMSPPMSPMGSPVGASKPTMSAISSALANGSNQRRTKQLSDASASMRSHTASTSASHTTSFTASSSTSASISASITTDSFRQGGRSITNFPPPLDKQKMLRLPSAGSRFQPPQYRRANANVPMPAAAFTANPLLIGRKKALDDLEYLYKNRIAKGGSTMVVIEGKAGTGKSSLVHNAALPDANIFPRALFVSTMYEPTRSSTEPYSALVDAILILSRKIRQREVSDAKKNDSTKANNSLRDFLLQPSVKQDLPLLKKVLPQLWDLAQLNKAKKTTRLKYSPVTHCKLEHPIEKIKHKRQQIREHVKSHFAQPNNHNHKRTTNDDNEETYANTDDSTISNSDHESSSTMSFDSDDLVRTASFQRLKALLRKLFADFCCKPSRPVVLHLDNVQYIDQASAELLQSLILDGRCYCEHEGNEHHAQMMKVKQKMMKMKQQPIHGLFLILSYRSADKNAHGSLSENLEDNIADDHKYAAICQTIHSVRPMKIRLDNLTQDQVHDVFIQLIQQAPNDRTREMAGLLYRKTSGNPYDLSQFLIYLQEEDHLYRDTLRTFQWEWKDPAFIESATTIPSSQVAIELAKSTFKKLHCATKAVLMVASCIGKDVIPSLVIENFFRAINNNSPMVWYDGVVEDDDSDTMDKIFSCSSIFVVQPEDVLEHLEIAVQHGILVAGRINARASIRDSVGDASTMTDSTTSSTSTATYTWSHEKVQEAAYTCLFYKKKMEKQQEQAAVATEEVSTAAQEAIHVRLGHMLWEMAAAVEDAGGEIASSASSSSSSDWMIYLSASQLNTVAKRRREPLLCVALGTMNLRAAKLSISKSAFYPAVELLEFGITNLPSEEQWDSKFYNITLELYTTLAETEYYLGHTEKSKEAIRQVMDHANRSNYDKYRVQLLLGDMAAMDLKRDYDHAQSVYIDILRQYGYKNLNKKVGWFRLARERRRLRRDFPKLTWRDIPDIPNLEVPEAEDVRGGGKSRRGGLGDLGKPSQQEIVMRQANLLTELAFNAVGAGNWRLTELCGLLQQRLTFQHGFTVHSIVPVMMPSVRLRNEKKFKEVFERTEISEVAMQRIAPNSPDRARCIIMLHGTVFHLNRPFHDSLDPLANVHKIFLSVGNMEPAFIAAMIYTYCYLSVGLSLSPLESDVSNYLRLATQFNMPPSLQVVFQMFHQTILNLQGEGYDMKNHPASLVGDVMDEDDSLIQMKASSQYIPTLRDLSSSRLMLACVFNDYNAMQLNLDLSVGIEFKDPLTARIGFRALYTALSIYFLLGVQGRANSGSGGGSKHVGPDVPKINKMKAKMYLKVAKEILRFHEATVKDGNVNAFPALLLMKAAKAQDEGAYGKAIVACGRTGLMHLDAIANEQLARLILRKTGDNPQPKDHSVIENYLVRALELYEDWGATGKVSQLKSEFEFLASSRRSKGTTTLKARTRFDARASTMLERVNLADVIAEGNAATASERASSRPPSTIVAAV